MKVKYKTKTFYFLLFFEIIEINEKRNPSLGIFSNKISALDVPGTQPHLHIYILSDCLGSIGAEMSNHNTDLMVQKSENICYLIVKRRNLPVSVV